MTLSRRFRVGAMVAGALFAILSSTASASDSLTRVITTAPPNLPESIAIDHQGTTYISFPFAQTVVQLAPGGILTPGASLPSFPLGVRLDNEGNLSSAVVGSGFWKVPAAGASA